MSVERFFEIIENELAGYWYTVSSSPSNLHITVGAYVASIAKYDTRLPNAEIKLADAIHALKDRL